MLRDSARGFSGHGPLTMRRGGYGYAMDPDVQPSYDSARLAEAFVELARTMVGELDVHELLQVLIDRSLSVLGVAASGLMLADGGRDLQTMVASSEQAEFLELFEIQEAEGPCLDSFRSGEPISVQDLHQGLDRWPRYIRRAMDQGFGSVIAVPMSLRQRAAGALNLFGTEDRPAVADATVRIAQAMVDVSAVAIEQGQLSRERATHIEHLETALESRLAIEQAKGVLSRHLDIGMQDAFDLLRRQARDTRRLLRDVAAETVNTGGRNFPKNRR
jgi:GAF domain-containing protein